VGPIDFSLFPRLRTLVITYPTIELLIVHLTTFGHDSGLDVLQITLLEENDTFYYDHTRPNWCSLNAILASSTFDHLQEMNIGIRTRHDGHWLGIEAFLRRALLVLQNKSCAHFLSL